MDRSDDQGAGLLGPEAVARRFPDFVPHWQRYLGDLGADAWSPGFVSDALTSLAASRLGELGEEGLIQDLFEFAELVLRTGTAAEQEAIATRFLEDLLNMGGSGRFDLEHMLPYLGPLSAEHCRGWDEFNGVRTPGLWAPGAGPGLTASGKRFREARRRPR
jgi:hypothetical protein